MRRLGIVVTVCLAVLAGAWFWARRDAGPRAGTDTKDETAVPAARAPAAAPMSPTLAGAPFADPVAAAVPESAPTTKAMLSFRVVAKADGKPIAGASVATFDRPLGMTDATGRLTVDAGLPPWSRHAQVLVRRREFGAKSASAEVGVTCDVALGPGRVLRGRVVEAPADRPVAGARVTAFDATVALDMVTTGSDGSFLVEDVADGEVTLCVRVDGRATVTRKVAVDPATEVVVRLEEGGVLEGVVTDAAGLPLSGVSVTAVADNAPPHIGRDRMYVSWHHLVEAMADRTTTDGMGRYKISGLSVPSTRYAFAEASARRVAQGPVVSFRSPGQRETSDVTIPTGGSLEVILDGWPPTSDAETAYIEVISSGLRFESMPSDRIGPISWRLTDLPLGRCLVRVGMLGREISTSAEIIESGRTTVVRLGIGTASSIGGRVVRQDGTHVAGAVVSWSGAGMAVTEADAEGRFRLEGLTHGPGTLRVMPRADFGEARAFVEGVTPGAQDVRIVMPLRPTVEGRLDSAGIEGTVTIDTFSQPFRSTGAALDRKGDGAFEVSLQAVDVPTLLVLRARGFAPLRVEVPPLRSGQRWSAGTLRFDRGRTVTLHVRDEAGAAVADALIIGDEPWSSGSRRADAEGRAVLERVSGGAAALVVSSSSHPPHAVALEPDVETVTVVLWRGGTLELRIVERDGSPAARARANVLPSISRPYGDPGSEREHPIADDGGRLTLPLGAGTWVLRVRSPTRHGETVAGPYEIRVGEKISAEIRLR